MKAASTTNVNDAQQYQLPFKQVAKSGRSYRLPLACKLCKMMGSAGFEPAASSAQGWHHTMLDNDPGEKLASQAQF
jgi:hypothetical protein